MAGSRAPKKLDQGLEMALAKREQLKNTHPYVWAIDYAINSKFPRLSVLHVASGKITLLKCAHGSGGANAKPHDGKAREFSNTTGSHMSNLGYALTQETYNGGNGLSLRIKGLSPTNSKMRPRLIVFHQTDNVTDGNTNISGRSWGCPAVSRKIYKWLIGAIEGGAVGVMHYNSRMFEGRVS